LARPAHPYREFSRGCLAELARVNPAGDPRHHMRLTAAAWRGEDGPAEVVNPLHSTTFGEVAPWIAIALGGFLFRDKIGQLLGNLGGLVHLPGAVTASVASAAAGQAPAPPSAAAAGVPVTTPTSGAGWAQVRTFCEQAAATWAQQRPNTGRLTCDSVNDATVVAIAAAARAQNTAGWPSGVRKCLHTKGEGAMSWGCGDPGYVANEECGC
jgi:hypothetical protein